MLCLLKLWLFFRSYIALQFAKLRKKTNRKKNLCSSIKTPVTSCRKVLVFHFDNANTGTGVLVVVVITRTRRLGFVEIGHGWVVVVVVVVMAEIVMKMLRLAIGRYWQLCGPSLTDSWPFVGCFVLTQMGHNGGIWLPDVAWRWDTCWCHRA